MGINLVKLQNENQERIQTKLFSLSAQNLNFSEAQLEITNLPVKAIRSLLLDKSSGLTLPDLFRMYHYKKQLHRNRDFALTDVFFDHPLKHARELQVVIENGNSALLENLPLLGFIISIKDSIVYKGTDCTLGFQEYVGKPYSHTAKIVEYLESKGAIVSCKGNVPQALMMIESYSTAFGNVQNPVDPTRSAGGSSGGDGALVATGLVNAAIGSDIGGSLRIPALFCGIYTLKPTAGRFANAEAELFEKSSDNGRTPPPQPLILSTIGPLAANLSDLETFAQWMNKFNEMNINLPPLAWTKPAPPTRVGFIKPFNNMIEVCLTAERAVDESINLLKSKNVEVIDIDLTDLIEEITINMLTIFFKDKELKYVGDTNSNIQEPLHDSLADTMSISLLTNGMLKKFIEDSQGQNRDELFCRAELLSRDNNFIALGRRQVELIDEVVARFRKADVECAICAGLPPAIKLDTSAHCFLLVVYLATWNYLNFPVGVLPVTTVGEDEQVYETSYSDLMAKILKDAIKNSKGLPVGIQVVGLPWKEELVIETMKLLDKKVKCE